MTDYTLKTEIGDGDVPVTIEFEYFPGTPAKLTGPMEDSYPAEESTLVLSSVSVRGDDIIIDLLDDSWVKHIKMLCLNYVASIGEA